MRSVRLLGLVGMLVVSGAASAQAETLDQHQVDVSAFSIAAPKSGPEETFTPIEPVEQVAVSGSTLTFRLIAPATVRFVLDRRVSRGRYRRVGSFHTKGRRGINRVRTPRRLTVSRLRKGVYRLSACTVSGGLTGPRTRRIFRVR